MSEVEIGRGTCHLDETVEDEDIEHGCAHIYINDEGPIDPEGYQLLIPRQIAVCGVDASDDVHPQGCPGGMYKTFDHCPGCGAPVCAYCRLLFNA